MSSNHHINGFIMKKIIPFLLLILMGSQLRAEDGYDLWLRYKKIDDAKTLAPYKTAITGIMVVGNSPTHLAALEELKLGLNGLMGSTISTHSSLQQGSLIIGTISSLKNTIKDKLPEVSGNEGFAIASMNINGKKITLITANENIGLLYGSFHLLRLMQSLKPILSLAINSSPALQLRLLNHWDNLNRHVERGYAGISIWNWHTLPDYKDKRYKDYARANASIGINGVTVTNVNANALVLTKPYLEKIAALADIFRPYGIKIFLTARFSAPMELDKFKTADPLDEKVRDWWRNKTDEIYTYIPDFGGFLVKANSEGQPGPQNYNRTHADGANMLADAVASRNGTVIWRAFVYSQDSDDRFKQAYAEFKPLDGKFNKNVLVQVKNGPIDFQPREPFSPLFGAMKKTPLMMEFQLTQEYLGQATHLVYEAPMFKEVLDADTYSNGKGSTVAKVIEGDIVQQQTTGMSGVSNIGNDRNWTGHLFAQANWYAYGRLAWNNKLSSEEIADEWIRQTFNNNPAFVAVTKDIMMRSHETLVNYMTPLGLHHIMGNGHHYGPAPWSNTLSRPDWNPVYYHKADSFGIGFNRTATGTNALAQYSKEFSSQYLDSNLCDEKFLLWFHHVSWSHKMKSGNTLWNELCAKYNQGVDDIKSSHQKWIALEKYVDKDRFEHVNMLLNIQVKDAIWWRNACLLYFQTFSKMPIPAKFEQPDKTLEYYKSLKFPYAPGNG
jgi:alpha-glucuronidase